MWQSLQLFVHPVWLGVSNCLECFALHGVRFVRSVAVGTFCWHVVAGCLGVAGGADVGSGFVEG